MHLEALAPLRKITITFDPGKTIKMASKLRTTFPLIHVTLKSQFLQQDEDEFVSNHQKSLWLIAGLTIPHKLLKIKSYITHLQPMIRSSSFKKGPVKKVPVVCDINTRFQLLHVGKPLTNKLFLQEKRDSEKIK